MKYKVKNWKELMDANSLNKIEIIRQITKMIRTIELLYKMSAMNSEK